MRGISKECLLKVGARNDYRGIAFPFISVYGKEVGMSIDLFDKTVIKYRIIIKDEFKKGVKYIYNENILPRLFYGKPVVITEGVYDCLSLYQFDIPCISPCTNRLTKAQAKKLLRYTNKVIFWFDSDKMGNLGLKETIETMKEVGDFKVRVVKSLEYKDPNEMLTLNPELFKTYVDKINGLMEELNG